MKNFTFLPARLATASFCLMLSFAAKAQAINTPLDLKQACENAPGNILTLTQSVKVSLPTPPFTPLDVPCGCTIVLTNDSKLEMEFASLRFAGPFQVQSTGKGEAVFIKSLLLAPSVSFNLGGDGSSISTSQSRLSATAGNLGLTMGRQAKLELYGRYSTSQPQGLSASGVVSINAGQQLTASITDMSVVSGTGVQINATGAEALLKLEAVGFNGGTGSIGITATGNKSQLEAKESNFFAVNNTNIRFSGSETGILLSEIGFYGVNSFTPSVGGVKVQAATGTNSNAKIEMSDIRTYILGGGFEVTAALNGEQGGVKLEKSSIRSLGAMVFRTGRKGTTEVKENRLTSDVSIRINTGTEGSCVATPNRTLDAPVVEACAPAVTARSMPAKQPISEVANTGLTVFPNPASNATVQLRFAGSAKGLRDVIVSDAAGRQVQRLRTANQQLSLTGIRPGVYNVQVFDGSGAKQTTRFVMGN